MKKVTLPCHEALWTALVAIDLSNQRAKSFSELLSDSRKEFKSTVLNENLWFPVYPEEATFAFKYGRIAGGTREERRRNAGGTPEKRGRNAGEVQNNAGGIFVKRI